MGLLDEPAFERLVGAGCDKCGSLKLGFRSYVDGLLPVMAAEPIGPIKWVYDGEKFIDGAYAITCASPTCRHAIFATADCPRCHATGGLARALADTTRLVVPKRCPTCKETELLALALIAATATYAPGTPPKPQPLVDFGEPGYHVVAFACEACEAAVVAQTCPLCDAPGPLRPRP